MTTNDLLPSAGYLRMKAEEIRTIADNTVDLGARLMLLRLFHDYERLVMHADKREVWLDGQKVRREQQ